MSDGIYNQYLMDEKQNDYMKHLIILVSLSLVASANSWSETYADSARWSSGSPMALMESKWLGLAASMTLNVSTNKISVVRGGELTVYNNKGNVMKQFTVRTIAKDRNSEGIQSCWISWERGRQPDHYLSIANCY